MLAGRYLSMALALAVVTAAPARAQQLRLAAGTDSGAPRYGQSTSSLLDRPARLSIASAPLATALTELRYRSGVLLVFSPSILPSGPVSCHCSDLSVGGALEQLLSGTTLRYVELDSQVLIRPARSSARAVVFARLGQAVESSHLLAPPAAVEDALRPVSSTVPQQATISGQVVEATTQRPLIGAQVSIPGTGIGGLTNNAGRYRLTNVPVGEVTVRVQMIGYRTEERAVSLASEQSVALDFALTEQALALDEIVVTGTAGAQQVRSLGNAVATIEAAELTELAPPTNIHALLAAKAPGVRMMTAGGEIGSGALIRIRGASSMSLSGQPLLYIDGVRVNNNPSDAGGVGSDGGYPPSRLNDLNPDDIASIEIIKGPAAATLYGTEASNGVIQIITRRGSEGEPTINMHVKQGANWIPSPKEFFPPTYYTSPTGEVVEFNVLEEDAKKGLGPWFTTGHPQSFGASVGGGTETIRYYFSGDYDRDEGPVSYNWMTRLSGRANLGYTPSDHLDFDLSLGTVRSRTQFASAMQPFTMAVLWSCPAPGCGPGSGLPNAVDGPWRGYNLYVPERYEQDVEGFEDVGRTTLSLQTTHRPYEWFTHRVTVGGDYGSAQSTELYRRIPEEQVGMFIKHGRKQVLSRRFSYTNIDYAATATLEPLEALSFATSGGIQYYERQRHETFAEGEIFPVRHLETVSAGASKTANEDFLENKTFGVYLQEQLSWNNRLFITAAIRGDDNSAFGKNFDFVVYPKLQASWVLSEEPLFQDLPFVSQLKLRSAWGRAGKQPDVFAALRTYEPSVGAGGAPTLTPENVGNPDLEPEVGEELEIGFDVGLVDDRVGIQFTYYAQNTTNAIVEVPALPSRGFPGTQFRNIGEVKNSGLELGIQANVYQGEDVGVDLGITFSTNENEVVDIGGGAPIVYSSFTEQFHVPGFPIGSIFQRRVVSADLDSSGDKTVAVNVMCEGGAILPGTSDLSRGGGAAVPCADAPRIYWGQPLPTWEGGVHTTITLFENLQLYGLVDFMGGHTLINGDMHFGHFLFGNTREIHERDNPILLGYETIGGSGAQQPGILDGGFAKLRALSATYTLPRAWTDRFGISRASITLSGSNLGVLWWAQREAFGIWQLDPEIRNTDGLGLSAFHQEGWPQLRRFLTTLRVTF